RIFSMYGLSECKRVSYLPPELVDERPYCVGKPMPNVDAWVADESGSRVPDGEIGVLMVRGSNVALGYWDDPELSGRIFRTGKYGERCLWTNDLFYQDAQGFLYFKGRTDDIIKSGAYRISLKEITDTILAIQGVSEVAVVPIPHEKLEFVMKAFIVLEPGCSLSEVELKRMVR